MICSGDFDREKRSKFKDINRKYMLERNHKAKNQFFIKKKKTLIEKSLKKNRMIYRVDTNVIMNGKHDISTD